MDCSLRSLLLIRSQVNSSVRLPLPPGCIGIGEMPNRMVALLCFVIGATPSACSQSGNRVNVVAQSQEVAGLNTPASHLDSIDSSGRAPISSTEPSTLGGVGHMLLEVVDSARGMRPIHVSVWYPSRNLDLTPRMSLADYARTIAVEGTATPVTPELAAAGVRELEDYLVSLGATREGAQAASRTRLRAHSAAPRPTSPLPTVLFALGKDESAVLHADLAERIAARGYVVITVPTVGAAQRSTSWAAQDVRTHAADLEHALRRVVRDGWTDTTRMAVVGYSYGSGAAALLAQRYRNLRGMVLLDGSIAFRDRLPTFREALADVRIGIPVLHIAARDDARLDLSLLREIARQPKVVVSDSTGHLDFTTLALVATAPGFEGFMRLGDDLLPPGVMYERISLRVVEALERWLK
jgi:dienelactone hydrolase